MSRRLMLKSSAGVSPVLPAEYQQVEWISTLRNNSSTTENLKYFDTLIPSQSGIGYAIKYARYARQAQEYHRHIIRIGGYNTLYDVNTVNAQAKIILSSNADTAQYLVSAKKNNREVFNVECNTDGLGSVFFDGVYAGQFGQYTGVTDIETICFMSRGNNAAYPLASSIYFYHAELYKDGQKIRKYVPVYRKLDGTIGLFELLNQTFLLPSGTTGSFTKGADIN